MKLTEIQILEIKNTITSALAEVYSKDFSLIQEKAHERSIVFRFGLYFSDLISQTSFGTDTNLTIDVDYNRNIGNVKTTAVSNRSHRILPDFIFHHRGCHDKNVLVIEFKGHWSNEGRDDQKLKDLTNQKNHVYHYCLGVFILLETSLHNCKIKYYIDGVRESK
jgi:hypothetical protein